jgi:hypothetical protein
MPTWTPPLSWLPRSLLQPENPWKAIAVGWGMAFPVSILIALVVGLIVPHAETPEFPGIGGPLLIFLLVVLSPVVESLIMGGVLLVLLRFLRPTWAVIVSAIGWGIAHSSQIAIWGLIIWWPFLIFSTLFVVWRERSLWLAFGLPMAVHALHNLPTSLLAAGGGA